VGQRTAKANQIRGLVAEYGLVAPQGVAPLRQAIPLWLEDGDNGLSDLFRHLLNNLYGDLREMDERLWAMNKEIELLARSHPVAQRLLKLRGVGPLIATALAAALGNGADFRRGRDFAVSLGLTPKIHGTGGKDRVLGISKRGDAYLRKLLVHGARAVIRHAVDQEDPLSRWINRLLARKHVNVVTVALANKTARMAWAMVRHGEQYRQELAVAA
jgi:transposase